MKIGEVITLREQKIIRDCLGMQDYHEVARKSGYSFATVNNIANRLTVVNKGNSSVMMEMFSLAIEKIDDLVKFKSEISEMKKSLSKEIKEE